MSFKASTLGWLENSVTEYSCMGFCVVQDQSREAMVVIQEMTVAGPGNGWRWAGYRENMEVGLWDVEEKGRAKRGPGMTLEVTSWES